MPKYSIESIKNFKIKNQKFATLTAYDYTSAKLVDQAEIPLILVGGFFHKRYKNRKQLRKWEIEELLEDLNDNENSN